ncbi:hypothetical protein LTR62_005521 [Meristemomyces frigidus]|uniref:Uncharacterized protein n=1 Tax=Meristemomyces frigidus TaxID=1508187 RepID=A0AAN7YNF2_9PEZI|nr:hypothetical protein LTR62_005521 [Meristemomyces frigidus]
MASSTNFGATIVQPPHKNIDAEDALLHPSGIDSPVLTPAVSHEDISASYALDSTKPAPPHSPFYQHPPTSMERITTTHSRHQSKTHLAIASEKDLETGLSPLATRSYDPEGEANPFTSAVNLEHHKECKMWPSKQTLMLQKAETRRQKHLTRACGGCAPVRQWWEQFDKRQQLIMKILLAFVTVGAIVGICVGISVKVHGTYYSNNGQQSVQHGSS